MDVYLGLKPQAESYCPFGAKTEFFTELLNSFSMPDSKSPVEIIERSASVGFDLLFAICYSEASLRRASAAIGLRRRAFCLLTPGFAGGCTRRRSEGLA